MDESGLEKKGLEHNQFPQEISPRKTSESGVQKTVEVKGKQWSYLEYGNSGGIPLLNLHGWLGSSAEGQDLLSRAFAGEPMNSPGLMELAKERPESAKGIVDVIKALEGKYHIIAPNLPGFGKTEALNDVSLDNLTESLADFQKAVGMEKSIIFGSSMGGILAIKLAARHPELPELVKAIILQGTMTRPDDMDKKAYVLAQIVTWGPIPTILEKLNLSKKLFVSIVKRSEDFKIANAETQQRILTDTLGADTKTAVKTLRELGKDIESDIKKVSCPVVVIDGASGELVPILKSAKLAIRFHPEINQGELVAKKKVIFFPVGGHGHNIVNTFPEGMAALIDDVLNKIM